MHNNQYISQTWCHVWSLWNQTLLLLEIPFLVWQKKLFEDAGITVISNVKPQVIERISRYTKADIFQSVNDLFFKRASWVYVKILRSRDINTKIKLKRLCSSLVVISIWDSPYQYVVEITIY